MAKTNFKFYFFYFYLFFFQKEIEKIEKEEENSIKIWFLSHQWIPIENPLSYYSLEQENNVGTPHALQEMKDVNKEVKENENLKEIDYETLSSLDQKTDFKLPSFKESDSLHLSGLSSSSVHPVSSHLAEDEDLMKKIQSKLETLSNSENPVQIIQQNTSEKENSNQDQN